MGSGLAGFSANFVTLFQSVTDSTPNSRAAGTGTSTTPTVISAPFST